MRQPLLALLLVLAAPLAAQTYFYIDEIQVQPPAPTDADDISIDLIGNLSSTGAYVVSAEASVTGSVVTINIVAADPGGFAVLVAHTETVHVGLLPPGAYTIQLVTTNVSDFSPVEQHSFVVSGGGSVCDNVEIVSVLHHAFSDTALVVHVLNSNVSEIFDYPNFILFDANGDTLAKEVISFIGIGPDSYHFLPLHPDAVLPTDPFTGTLELWTGFTTLLACEWELEIDLCPPPPCATLIPMVQNLGGALAIGSYPWNILDMDMNSVATGTFVMTDLVQMDADTICLAPGNYQMFCYAAEPPTGGQPVFSLSTEGWIAGPSQPVSFGLPAAMSFSFHTPCADGSNAVPERVPEGDLQVSMQNGTLTLLRRGGDALGDITVHDAEGRLLVARKSARSSAQIELPAAAGVLIVRAANSVARIVLSHE